MDPRDDTVPELAIRVAEALGDQVGAQVDLIQAEVAEGLATFGRDAAPLVVGGLLVALGYCWGCVGLAQSLGVRLGAAGGSAVVGLINVLVGALAIGVTMRRRAGRRRLAADRAETARFEPGVFDAR